MRLGLGLGFGLGSALAVGGPFYPTQLPNAVAWWDLERFQTYDLGSTLLASGTTPPVATISGTHTVLAAPRIEVTTGGANPVIRWSMSNTGSGAVSWDATGVAVTAGTPLVLGSTGLTLTMPVGTYATNNVYQGTLRNWRSVFNGSDVLTQATAAKQPRILIDATSGKPFARSAPAASVVTMTCSTIDRPAPGTTPTFYYGIGKYDVRSQFRCLTYCGDGTGYRLAIVTATATATEISISNGANVTAAAATMTSFRRFMAGFKSSTAGKVGTDPAAWGDFIQWGAAASSAAAAAGPTDPVAGFSIFSRFDVGDYADASLGAFGIFAAYPAEANLTKLDDWASTYWAASVLT